MRMLTQPLLLCALMLLSSINEISGWRTHCQQRWNLINGRCFKYVPRRLSWAQAERNCISMGGNLASVHNSEEYHEIQALILHASHEMKETWIGGSDAAEEGVWSWTDGTLLTFSNWCPGEPNNGRGHQHCMQMNYSAQKCWDDHLCRIRQPSVCALKK
ncbi:type-2 ice-structuring protein-like [Anableps anableps]